MSCLFTNATELTDLPTDILFILPHYLHSLDDLYALIRTCRVFYNTCASSTAVLPPSFAKRLGQHLPSPYPHFILTATARQIADWAVQSDERRDQLLKAIKQGPQGLFDLATKVSRLRLDDVRGLHRAKLEVLDPLSRQLDLDCGRPYYCLEAERRGINYDPNNDWEILTICRDTDQALLSYLIYCELFYYDVDKACDPTAVEVEPLSLEIRLTWINYCVPDKCNLGNNRHTLKRERDCCQALDLRCIFELSDNFCNDPTMGRLLLRKSKEDGFSPHEGLFVRIMNHQGLTSLRLLLPGGMEALGEEIAKIREQVYKLKASDIDNRMRYREYKYMGVLGRHTLFTDVRHSMGCT